MERNAVSDQCCILAMSAGTVLVVEDNAIRRRLVRLALEGSGYDVVEADDRAQALEAAATRPPDLIVTRDVLRDGDGLTLVDEIRRRVEAPVAAIVLWRSRRGTCRSMRRTRPRTRKSSPVAAWCWR